MVQIMPRTIKTGLPHRWQVAIPALTEARDEMYLTGQRGRRGLLPRVRVAARGVLVTRPVYLYPPPPPPHYVAAVSCRCERAPVRCDDCARVMRANHVHVYRGDDVIVVCPRCANDDGAC